MSELDGAAVGAGERVAAAAAGAALDAAGEAAEREERGGGSAAATPATASPVDWDAEDEREAAAALAAARAVVADAGAADGARPWDRVTRLADALAAVADEERREREKAAAAAASAAPAVGPAPPAFRTAFPPLPPAPALPPQCNEAGWAFTLDVTPDGGAVELEVALGLGVRPGAVDADVRPRAVRVLAAGALLTVHLPLTVAAEAATARRSAASGALVITAPRALGGEEVDAACLRPAVARMNADDGGGTRAPAAVAVAADGEGVPPLTF